MKCVAARHMGDHDHADSCKMMLMLYALFCSFCLDRILYVHVYNVQEDDKDEERQKNAEQINE